MQDVGKPAEELPPEVVRALVVGTELSPKGLPGNQARLSQIAHSVGEPDVDVEGERRAFQEVERPQVDRDGGPGDLFEELVAEDDPGAPARLLPSGHA